MSMNRREVLKAGAASAAALVLGRSALAAAGTRRLTDIGIIGGVPKDAGGDWQKSLRHMANEGYTLLESRPRGPIPEFRKFLSDIGMKWVCCGVDFGRQLKPDWLDTAAAAQVPYAAIYWPWFHPLEKLTMSQLQEIAERLNACGEKSRAAGVKLAIHNHDRDFALLEGKPIFDRLIEMTQPDLVTVELDLYWVVKAGRDPLDYFARYPGRFELLHVKDMGPLPEGAFVPVGAGTIDFGRIFAKSEQGGVRYSIVELEGASATTKGAEESVRFLKQLRF